jgi:hypothetical protein
MNITEARVSGIGDTCGIHAGDAASRLLKKSIHAVFGV